MAIRDFLDSFTWQAGVGFTFVTSVFFAIVVIVISRNCINKKTLKAHHDVSGFVFANLGVLYSVLLGFTVVSVQQRYDKMKEYAQIEAGYLQELYFDSVILNENAEIQRAIYAYANDVIDREWKLMSKLEYIPKINQKLEDLWKIYYSIELKNKKQEIWFSESISKLNQLMNARLSRLIGIQDSLSSETWTVLIITGIIIIIFVCAFGFESIGLQILMGSTISLVICLTLFLIYSMDTVYSGAIQLNPDAMMNILESIKK